MTNPCTVLFFSRGRGRGHAELDILLRNRIAALSPSVDITFASYATGYSVFLERKIAAREMPLPENNTYLATFMVAHALIKEQRPNVVIAHEEFAALTAAHLLNVPAIFISTWLPSLGTINSESLKYASDIIVMESPGIFPVSPDYPEPIYTDIVWPDVEFTTADRPRIRSELGISAHAPFILVVPGGWATEERAPVVDLVLAAFTQFDQAEKSLLFISKGDYPYIRSKTQGVHGAEAIPYVKSLHRLIAASDLVITKGTYSTTLTAARIGVPSLALTRGSNPIDEVLVPRIKSNTHLFTNALTPATLAAYFRAIVAQPPNEGIFLPTRTQNPWTKNAAAELAACIDRASSRSVARP